MKKTLLSLLLLGGLSANAQLASGSTAPDFTATDINGVEHSLYADYLNQGKTVIIDISATWCGPCWRYHGTHALADFYETYGPNGSNEVVVLFIEGDPGTSVQSLYGTNTSSDTSTTQGNWTNHSPYPIIDDGTGAISNAYAIQYFPTVYMICPNGNVTELTNNANPPTAPILKSKITNSCQTLTGAVNKARFDAVTTPICQQNGVVVAPLKNLGTNKILSATAVLKENGNVIATKNYTSTTGVSLYNTTNLTFPATNFTDGVHTIELTEINGLTTLPHPETATQDVDIILNNDTQVGNNLTVEIYTDFYPAEASWEIRNNSTNALVASGGPYTAGTEDTFGGGGPDANTTITSTVTLPDTDDCYKVILKDSNGDGWYFQTSNSYDPNAFRGIKILNGDNVVYEKNVNLAAFSTANFAAALRTVSVSDAFQPGANKAFSVYPNPTNGILNIQSTENVSITVTDMAGKTVFAAKDIQNGGTINLGSLQKGIYIATMKGESGAQNSEKIVIN